MQRLVLAALVAVSALAHAAGPRMPAVDLLGDPLPPGAALRLGTPRGYHSSAAVMAWSPDEKSLAHMGQMGEVIVSGVPSLRRRWISRPAKDNPENNSSLVFSPDNTLLAAARFMGRSVVVFDARTGKELARRDGGVPWSVRFAPDGTLLIADKDAVLSWDWKKGAQPRELFKRKWARSLAVTSDGKSIVVMTKSEGGPLVVEVAVHGLKDGKEASKHKVPTKNWKVVLSGDGRFAAFVEPGDKGVGVLDTATGKVVHRMDADVAYDVRPALSADGTRLTLTSRDGVARVMDTGTGKVRSYPLGLGGLELAALSEHGTRLAVTARADSCIHLFAMNVLGAREMGPKYFGHRRGPLKAVFAKDGRELVTTQHGLWTTPSNGWEKWSFRRWDARTGKETFASEHDLKGVVWHMALSPDGKLAMAGTDEGRIWVFDAISGRQVRDWLGPVRKPRAPTKRGRRYPVHNFEEPVFSQDGKQLLVRSEKKLMRWEVATGKELPAITGWHNGDWETPLPAAQPWSAFCVPHPGGEFVLAAGQSSLKGRASLVDLKNPRLRRAVDAADWNPWAMAFSSDGRTIAVGANTDYKSHYVRLIEVASGKERARFYTDGVRLDGVAISPCGRLVAGAGYWKEGLHLWSALTGKLLHVFPGKYPYTTHLAFSPDSKRLLSTTGDNTATLWDVGPYLAQETGPGPSKAELEKALDALAGEDAGAAYKAMWLLARAPAQSVPLMRERLQGLKLPGATETGKLVAVFEGPAALEALSAGIELLELGRDAVPAVRSAIKGKRGAGLLRMLEMSRAKDGSATLVTLRCLEALERAGAPEAVKLIEELSKGEVAGAEAREALARCKPR